MKNFLMSLTLLLSFTLITSCGNDDEMMETATCSDGIQNGTETGIDCGGDCAPCETTVAQDMANVQQTFDDLGDCAHEIDDARSTNIFVTDFLNLVDGDALNEDWIEEITNGLENVFDFNHIEN